MTSVGIPYISVYPDSPSFMGVKELVACHSQFGRGCQISRGFPSHKTKTPPPKCMNALIFPHWEKISTGVRQPARFLTIYLTISKNSQITLNFLNPN